MKCVSGLRTEHAVLIFVAACYSFSCDMPRPVLWAGVM
jgi:hypothetical protein